MGQASELRLPRREEISSNIFLFFNYGKKSDFYYGILLDFEDKRASTLTYFMARALPWFKQIYNFEFEKVLSDNGPEFKGSLNREHPFEMMCDQLGIKHICTRPYRPQTNGKVEAFWKIIKNEFFYPNSFDSVKDLIYNLGNFLFEYNHLRRHGGLLI